MDEPIQSSTGKYREALRRHRNAVKEVALAFFDDFAAVPGPNWITRPIARKNVEETIDNYLDDQVK